MKIEDVTNVKRKRRVLFYGTYPDQGIGYSRIANIITNYLASQEHLEVFYYGISNFITEEERVNRYIHPNITFIDAYKIEKEAGNNELYGVNLFCDYIKKLKPDIVFIYNDIIVISRLFNEYLKHFGVGPKDFKTYLYLDLVYDFERNDLIQNLFNFADKVFTFSNYWKEQLQMLVPNHAERIYELRHGIDNNAIIVNSNDCKKYFGLNPDDFVILNTNRNAYRKAWDVTIGAFIIFLKKNDFDPKLKLMINCTRETTAGFNLLDVIRTMALLYGVQYENLITRHIFLIPRVLSDEDMNKLYNGTDLGINTAMGEGFGLCNIEHASRWKPQVVAKVGGLVDIFHELSDITHVQPSQPIFVNNLLDNHNGLMYICSHETFAEKIDYVYKNYEYCLKQYKDKVPNILKKYKWTDILKTLDIHFR